MRPYVHINVAATADGKIDTFERKGAGISSRADKDRVLRLRARADAVMVGGHTLLAEDPNLTVKTPQLRAERLSKGLPENPIKVGVVSRADLKLDGDFMTAGPAQRLIFTTSQTPPAQVENLKNCGAEVHVIGEKRVNLPLALDVLYTLGVRLLLVEGGATLNFELLKAGLVDELTIYQAPMIFGGQAAPTLAGGDGLLESTALHLKLLDVCTLDESGGVLLSYHVLE